MTTPASTSEHRRVAHTPASYGIVLRTAVRKGYSWPGSTVPYVHDGDTFDAHVSHSADLGFGSHTTTAWTVRLRLARINAPALHTDDGVAAQKWLARLLCGDGTTAAPILSLVTLSAYKYGGPAYSPGEWMAEVVLPDGRNVSDLAVKTGHAAYWNGQGPRPDDGTPA